MRTETRISIVTAVLDAADALRATAQSLRAQRYRDFEWLVVDGGSSDDVIDVLLEYQDVVSWWMSEPDTGIYDAWNKACSRINGGWVLFLGAGDRLVNEHVLGDAATRLDALAPEVELAYGQLQWVSAGHERWLESLGQPWDVLRDRWEIGRPALPPHGATFHRRRILLGRTPFDLRFPIASDSHFLLRHLGSPPVFIGMPVLASPVGGASLRLESAIQVAREIRLINRDLGIHVPWRVRLHDHLRLATIALLLLFPDRIRYRLADAIRGMAGKPGRWSSP